MPDASTNGYIKPGSLIDYFLQIQNVVTKSEEQERNVLVLYTGGTIGMVRNEQGVYVPAPNLIDEIRKEPRMHDVNYASMKYGECNETAPLVLPKVGGLRRIIYSIREYEQILDSCNMTAADWIRIASDIQHNYEFYDGFVVLHGTDTLTYTASVLSFMLENLGKPVIITGSQIPIFEVRSDGNDNFIGSLLLAGNFVIPEVTVFFCNKLIRGNRAVKYNSHSFDAFLSPNAPELANYGIEIKINENEIFYPRSIQKFKIHTELNENVGMLRIFPNISADMVRSVLHPGVEGVVLETYGSGNFPSNRSDLLYELKEATARNVIIINCSQCCIGRVSDLYECGKILADIGVVCGHDMTTDAALAKLSYVLAKDWDFETKKQMLCENLRGEMSSDRNSNSLNDWDIIDAVCRSLHISSQQKRSEIVHLLFPAIINGAVVNGDINRLKKIKAYGANLNMVNADSRSPLHIACTEGKKHVVKHLLLNGAIVHVKDRYGKTPLMDAVLNDHHEVIKLLRNCGAHISGNLKNIAEDLCSAAGYGLIDRLNSYYLAGMDLNQTDMSERTALHLAVLHDKEEAVKFLLECGVDIHHKDMLGQSAVDYAVTLNREHLLQLLLK